MCNTKINAQPTRFPGRRKGNGSFCWVSSPQNNRKKQRLPPVRSRVSLNEAPNGGRWRHRLLLLPPVKTVCPFRNGQRYRRSIRSLNTVQEAATHNSLGREIAAAKNSISRWKSSLSIQYNLINFNRIPRFCASIESSFKDLFKFFWVQLDKSKRFDRKITKCSACSENSFTANLHLHTWSCVVVLKIWNVELFESYRAVIRTIETGMQLSSESIFPC